MTEWAQIAGHIIGSVGLVMLVLSFQQNRRSSLLNYQVLSSLLFAINYLLIGAYTGALINVVTLSRNIIYTYYGNRKIPLVWPILFIVSVVAFTVVTYEDWFSILPGIATAVYTVALLQKNLFIIRAVNVVTSLTHMVYNIKVYAVTAAIATASEATSAFVSILRYNLPKSDRSHKIDHSRKK